MIPMHMSTCSFDLQPMEKVNYRLLFPPQPMALLPLYNGAVEDLTSNSHISSQHVLPQRHRLHHLSRRLHCNRLREQHSIHRSATSFLLDRRPKVISVIE